MPCITNNEKPFCYLIFRLNEYPDTGQTAESPAGGFSWMSQTLKQLRLPAKQTEKISLSVSFSKPGVYNINNIAVFVSYQHDTAEMTLQKQTKPSVITICDVPSWFFTSALGKQKNLKSFFFLPFLHEQIKFYNICAILHCLIDILILIFRSLC